MKKSIISITLMCVMIFACAVTAAADSVAIAYPFTVELEGGSKVLCVTPRDWDGNEVQPKSGLYYNETPLRNIYYFDESFYELNAYLHEVVMFCSNDGVYVAHIPWAELPEYGSGESQTSGKAVLIYKNGVLLKSYTVGDLIENERKLSFSVSHVNWEDSNKREFDAESNILTLTTLDKRVLRLDITTGEISADKEKNTTQVHLPAGRARFVYEIIGGVSLLVIVFGIIYLLEHSKKRRG